MWTITKEFDFCYGHRVWSQQLNTKFSLDGCLKCRHLHGHQGKLLVSLESNKLKDGMVTDFKHLSWFRKWLDDVIDHKFIIDSSDPLFHKLFPDVGNYTPQLNQDSRYFVFHKERYWTVYPPTYKNLPSEEKELYEGMIIVPFVPTSENLSKWFFKIVEEKMKKLNIKVSKIQFFETPKSQSIYEE